MKDKDGNEIVVPEVVGDAGIINNSVSLLDLQGLKANSTTSTLRKDEWKVIDSEMIEVAGKIMNGIEDLISNGLVVQNGGLGTVIHEYEVEGDMSDADLNMDGSTNQNEDAVEFGVEGVPVPIIGKTFKINKRRLEASRMRGETVDTSQTRISTRKVSEKLETVLFKGAGVKVDGRSIYGYTTLPQRSAVTILGDYATTPANIEKDIRTLLAAADSINRKGPFMIYVSVSDFSAFRQFISTTGDTLVTYYKAMLEAYGSQIIDIKPTFALDANNIVMVQMDKDTVDLSVSQDMTVLELQTKFMEIQMMVFAAMVPRVKYDGDDTSGVFHGTKE